MLLLPFGVAAPIRLGRIFIVASDRSCRNSPGPRERQTKAFSMGAAPLEPAADVKRPRPKSAAAGQH